MIVFLTSGIWHGANWTYILWGMMHGLAFCVTRALADKYNKLHVAFQWFITFVYCSVLWLLFRAQSIGQWLMLVLRMLKMETLSVREELINCFTIPEREFLIDAFHLKPLFGKAPWIGAMVVFIFSFCICLNHKNNIEKVVEKNLKTAMLTALLLAISILSLSGVSVFIYFDF